MSRDAPHSPLYAGDKPVSAVDWRGNRFHVGQQVLYCIAAGRGQMMAIGEVLTIKVTEETRRREIDCSADDPDADTRPWFQPDRYFRWEDYAYEIVQVQVRTLKTSGRWGNRERQKPAWVNPMNITALPVVETP